MSKCVLLVLAVGLMSLCASAGRAAETIRFRQFTVEDGLPVNEVRWMVEGRLGFLWLGTPNGLVRYDGYSFVTYSPEADNPNSLSDGSLMEMVEDAKGDLWIGTTSGGLNRFDRESETFESFRHDPDDPESLIGDAVFTLHLDRSGILWVGTNGSGLDRFDPVTKVITHYPPNPEDPTALSDGHVYAITEDRRGNIWVGTKNGLNRLDPESGRFKQYFSNAENPTSLSGNIVTTLAEDAAGFLWVGTERGGLNRLDPSTEQFKHWRHDPADPASIASDQLMNIRVDDSGVLWIGTLGAGLERFDPARGVFDHYRPDPNVEQTLSGGVVLFTLEDSSGTLWVCTDGTGLNKADRLGQTFDQYRNDPQNANSLGSNWVTSLEEGDDGEVWLGTMGGGVNRFEPETGRFDSYVLSTADSIVDWANVATALERTSDGTIWAGSVAGSLHRLDSGASRFEKVAEFEAGTFLGPPLIRSIREDAAGRLWVGAQGRGLNEYLPESRSFRNVLLDSLKKGDHGGYINFILQDRAGMLWVGTPSAGLWRLHPGTGARERILGEERAYRSVVTMHEDDAGRLWVGTFREGLVLLDPVNGNHETITTEKGLPHNTIKSIVSDPKGILWVGTDNGIARIDPETRHIRSFNRTDGLLGGIFTMNGALRTKDGRLFFGSLNGLNALSPNGVTTNPYPPRVVVTDVKIRSREATIGPRAPLATHVSVASDIRVNHGQNDFTFTFAALHYHRPDRNLYSHMLENYDVGWSEISTRRTATYTNLDPGEYVFRVRGANSDGVWSSAEATLTIHVCPPFWATWTFRIGAGLAAIAVLAVAYRQRVRHIQDKRQALESQVKERSEAAEKLEDALGEVERLKNRLEAENVYLQEEIKLTHNFEEILTRSEVFKKVLGSVEQVASTGATVLVLGESGTGKELLARAIHSISPRSERPLVKVNCAALPANLIESELFGHVKGAFTGAVTNKPGRFELADGGTLFLDEIGEIPLELQSKLLRVLQEGEFERLGDTHPRSVDVRIIAATNRNLEKAVAEGSFREDLYYRLNVFPISIPALRERREDIPLLVQHFVDRYSTQVGKQIDEVPQSLIDTLDRYHWPGNVRELENIIERAVIVSPGHKLFLGDWLPEQIQPSSTASEIETLEETERNHILRALEKTGWRVSGDRGAARILGINPKTLDSRMRKLGIRRAERV